MALIQFYNSVKYISTSRNTFGAFNFQSTMKYTSSCMKYQSQAYWYQPSIWLIQWCDTYVLSTVCRLYPKKVHQQLHKQSAQVKKLDLPRKRLIGKLPAPVVWLFEDRVSMICLTCQEDLPRWYTYLFHSAMDWHKSLCKVICASRRGRQSWIKNPISDQLVRVLTSFYSQHNASRRAWM